jgi:uncharacterized iron-regulated protein
MSRSAVLPVTSLALSILLAACGGAASSGPGPHDPADHAAHGHHGGPMDIRKAALPYRVLKARGGAEVPVDAFFAELASAEAVCVGESHKNPHHHWLQLEVLERLSADAQQSSRALALGMEMFQRPFQGVLDDFAAGTIDESALLARTGWEERWGYDWGFYQPMVALAVAAKHPVLALNAPAELTRKVGQNGLGALSPDEKKQLPDLVLDDEEHRAWFQQATQGHGGAADDSFDNFYSAQVIWDETMADTAWRWLSGQNGARQIVILAGNGHCMEAAIPRRLARRGAKKVVSIQAVMDDGGSAVADLLAAPENDYIVVLDVTGK